jgi:hypothetical protein
MMIYGSGLVEVKTTHAKKIHITKTAATPEWILGSAILLVADSGPFVGSSFHNLALVIED